MKKGGYILLLFILFLQAGGMLYVYKIQQYSVQHHMQQQLGNAHSVFHQMVLSLKEYQKSRINKHEIKVNDQLFDVKSVYYTGGKVCLQVIRDSKEEKILAKIRDLSSRNKTSNSAIPKVLKRLISMNYLSLAADNNQINASIAVSEYMTLFLKPWSIDPELLTPPPKLV